MTRFIEHIMQESQVIGDLMSEDEPMLPLTKEEKETYGRDTMCPCCKGPYDVKNRKTRHHCHITGRFISAACNNCNLQLKLRGRKRQTKTVDGVETENYDYSLPIIFHNLKNYDAHFIIKNFQRKYVEHVDDKSGKVTYDDVNVIPINTEKFMIFEIGKLRFLDSFQFLSSSLEKLVGALRGEKGAGNAKFMRTGEHFRGAEPDLIFGKGVYPYGYMTSIDRFAETKLPPIDDFYNALTEECIADTDYKRAQDTWDYFKIKNMQQ